MVVTLEAFVGLITVAMATGLMFAKFSRPTARVLFSDKIVIAPAQRQADADAAHGERARQRHHRGVVPRDGAQGRGERRGRARCGACSTSPLVRGDTPLFTLTFQALHVIDDESPLRGDDAARSLREGQLRFIVTVTGLDATFATTIHARRIYEAERRRLGTRASST